MTGCAGPAPARVRELAEQGLGRNACARELGVSRRQIDQAAREAGIDWTRTTTEAATKARMIDRRAELLDDFSEIADRAAGRLLDALDADELDPNVLRALANVTGVSLDKLTALGDRMDNTSDTGDSLLDQLAAGVGEWAEALANQTDTEQHTE